MMFEEKPLSSERIYEGRVVNLRRDRVELADGSTATREVVEHSGGVAVLALDEADNVFMVRQFRYGIGRETLEIPAGKRERGEDPRLCGLRELEEETGHVAGRFKAFGSVDPTPAYDSEVIHLFLAEDLRPTAQRLDPGEFLSVERIPFAEVVALCLSGDITDAKTLAAVLKLYAMRQGTQVEG
jgi:ADP-ribose pyrophosphatase